MLKGNTKIELRDVHTGQVEVIEKENMVTNALQYIFNPMGLVKAVDTFYSTTFTDFYTTLTGGLLLLDSRLEEDADNIDLPGNVEQTGCAVYGQQNTSDQTKRGNYNSTESEIDVVNRRVKYVYDFDTAEGNGTIASVALTHALGGYTNRGLEEKPTQKSHPYFVNIGSSILRLTGKNGGINACDRTLGYTTYGSSYRWIVKIDAKTDSVYYFTITGTNALVIYRYRANITTISLFDSPSTTRTLLEEKEIALSTAISQQYFSYNYDEEADKLYICSGSNYSVSKTSSYVITEIDMANGYAVKQYTMTNKSGTTMRLAYEKSSTYCYRGYVYFQNYNLSDHYIYRQEIGNSANIAQLETSISLGQAYPMHALNGKVYFDNNNSYNTCFYIIDVEKFTLLHPESNTIYDYSGRQYVQVRGFPLMYYMTSGSTYGTFGMRTDYLATINNLDTAVVKTADKTMKITYTLMEVDETTTGE